MFDQEYCKGDNEHYLEIDDESFEGDDVQFLVHRLLKAAATPDVRRAMEIEDEIYSEIETRDATIMQKEQEIEQNKQVIEQKDQMLRSMVKTLCQQGITPEDIATQLSIPVEQIRHLINKTID